jgi:hypothetical protein
MLSKRIFSALLLVSTLGFAACDGSDPEPTPTRPTQTFTCTAKVSPGILDYIRDGNLLQVSTGGQSQAWTLVSEGSGVLPAFGTWHITDSVDSIGTTSLDVVIENGFITAVADCDFGTVGTTARATAAADITASTINILQSNEDTQTVTR